jgi:hypothetical protein
MLQGENRAYQVQINEELRFAIDINLTTQELQRLRSELDLLRSAEQIDSRLEQNVQSALMCLHRVRDGLMRRYGPTIAAVTALEREEARLQRLASHILASEGRGSVRLPNVCCALVGWLTRERVIRQRKHCGD